MTSLKPELSYRKKDRKQEGKEKKEGMKEIYSDSF